MTWPHRLSAFILLLPRAWAAASSPIILRNLAEPRFFGAAANTTFLFHDQNYTQLAETQVCFYLQHL